MFFKLTLTKVTVGSLGVVLGLCCHCSHCFVGTNSAREAKIHRSLCSLSARILSGVLFCWRLYGQVFSSAYIREKHHRHCWPELWYVETAFPGSCSFTRSVRQHRQESSRVTETSSTPIDVIMTSSIDLVERSGVLKSHISDHYLVYALLKLKISKPPPSYVKVRSYKNYDSQLKLGDPRS